MPYTVPNLTDFSKSALDSAARELLSALDQESAAVKSDADFKIFRDRWMGRKNGVLTQLNDLWLKRAPGPSKREVGQRVNELKKTVEVTVEGTLSRKQSSGSASNLAAQALDTCVNLPTSAWRDRNTCRRLPSVKH